MSTQEASAKRLARYEADLGRLVYEHYALTKQIEGAQRRMERLDIEMAATEAAIKENNTATLEANAKTVTPEELRDLVSGAKIGSAE